MKDDTIEGSKFLKKGRFLNSSPFWGPFLQGCRDSANYPYGVLGLGCWGLGQKGLGFRAKGFGA